MRKELYHFHTRSKLFEWSVLMTTTEVAVADAKPPVEITVEDFSAMVGSLSRLFTGLSALQPLKDADLGIADWLVLTMLAQEDGISNKMLARNLGVSGQRANQICTSLASDSLIVVDQSEEDKRSNSITITAAGKSKVTALNAELKLLLSDALGGKVRSMKRTTKNIKNLMKVVRAGQPAKVGKPGKEAKREAKEAKRKVKQEAKET
jgi:DNA-binding MarR family transcriptional regulator